MSTADSSIELARRTRARLRLQDAADAHRIDAASLVNRQAQAARVMLGALNMWAAELRGKAMNDAELAAYKATHDAIAQADAAGIKAEDDGPIDPRSFVPVQP